MCVIILVNESYAQLLHVSSEAPAQEASGVNQDAGQDGAIAREVAAVAPQAASGVQHENNGSTERLSLVEIEKLEIEKVGQKSCSHVALSAGSLIVDIV